MDIVNGRTMMSSMRIVPVMSGHAHLFQRSASIFAATANAMAPTPSPVTWRSRSCLLVLYGGGQSFEQRAALLVVLEHVVARARRRQQHRVTRHGERASALDDLLERAPHLLRRHHRADVGDDRRPGFA